MPPFKPFSSERQFHAWFKKHLGAFGFDKALTDYQGKYHLTTPDFWCLVEGWRDGGSRYFVRCELELLSQNFIQHEHVPGESDYIVCCEDNFELYGAEPPIGVIEVGLPVATGKWYPRSANRIREILDAYRRQTAHAYRSLASTLAWFQPGDARSCWVCSKVFTEFTTTGAVNWGLECSRHNTCWLQVIARLKVYVDKRDLQRLRFKQNGRIAVPGEIDSQVIAVARDDTAGNDAIFAAGGPSGNAR